MKKSNSDPMHPGVPLKLFLKEAHVSQQNLAQTIGVSPELINAIVEGEYDITANMALRLGHFFAVESQFWTYIQSNYDVAVARKLGIELPKPEFELAKIVDTSDLPQLQPLT